MKKLFLAAVLAAASIVPASAQTLWNGSRFLDLSIGVGSADGGAMFTQRLAAEWIVKSDLFSIAGKPFSLGVGFQIDNAYGGSYSSLVAGSYDYRYTVYTTRHTTNHGRPVTTTDSYTQHRKGAGFATCDVARDNFDLMPTVSLHGQITDRLDLYVNFGLGVGVMNNMLSNYENAEVIINGIKVDGFQEANHYKENEAGSVRYSYNDIDHAKWNKDPYKSKAVFACSFFLGARYFISSDWAVNAQLGLVSADVSKDYGNTYNVFSVGASYSF